MGEFIHFRGKDAIIEAYENNGVPACALCSGKDLLFCYDGNDIDEGAGVLGEFIERLSKGHSQGVYQLRMYKNPPEDITIATKQSYSFKCKIMSPEAEEDQMELMHATGNYRRRIEALEAKLAESEDMEEEEPIPAWQQTINGVLQRPDVQNFVMSKIFGFVEKIMGGASSPAGAHAMNGVPESAQPQPGPEGQQTADQLYQQLPPSERQQLDQAMQILLAGDPQIGTNLYKIALILKSNPGKYRGFAAML